jgi:hypothetical protein
MIVGKGEMDDHLGYGKRQPRLSGVDDLVIPLSAKGLTHGEISGYYDRRVVYVDCFGGSRNGPL